MSKDKVRVYQLARDLGVESKDLIDLLHAAGVDIKNHMTTLDPELRQLAYDLATGAVKPGQAKHRLDMAAQEAGGATPNATAETNPIPPPKPTRPSQIPSERSGRGTETTPPPKGKEPMSPPSAVAPTPATELGPVATEIGDADETELVAPGAPEALDTEMAEIAAAEDTPAEVPTTPPSSIVAAPVDNGHASDSTSTTPAAETAAPSRIEEPDQATATPLATQSDSATQAELSSQAETPVSKAPISAESDQVATDSSSPPAEILLEEAATSPPTAPALIPAAKTSSETPALEPTALEPTALATPVLEPTTPPVNMPAPAAAELTTEPESKRESESVPETPVLERQAPPAAPRETQTPSPMATRTARPTPADKAVLAGQELADSAITADSEFSEPAAPTPMPIPAPTPARPTNIPEPGRAKGMLNLSSGKKGSKPQATRQPPPTPPAPPANPGNQAAPAKPASPVSDKAAASAAKPTTPPARPAEGKPAGKAAPVAQAGTGSGATPTRTGAAPANVRQGAGNAPQPNRATTAPASGSSPRAGGPNAGTGGNRQGAGNAPGPARPGTGGGGAATARAATGNAPVPPRPPAAPGGPANRSSAGQNVIRPSAPLPPQMNRSGSKPPTPTPPPGRGPANARAGKKSDDVQVQRPVKGFTAQDLQANKVSLPRDVRVQLNLEPKEEAATTVSYLDRELEDRDSGSAAKGKKPPGKGAARSPQESFTKRGRDMHLRLGRDDDEEERNRRRRQKEKRGKNAIVVAPRTGPVVLAPPVTVRSFSEATGVRAKEVLHKLIMLGNMCTVNSVLDAESVEMLGLELNLELDIKQAVNVETSFDEVMDQISDDPADLEPRPPVVTFMGHVDHGKTSLMDRIRSASVASGESGGITQHIGAYQVNLPGDGVITKATFLDTPGHKAFTEMRARGANVTDIVVLVVAADDGLMPQTEEAISHAQAAEVPIIVAINKVDLLGANIGKVQQQLAGKNLLAEEFGGDVVMVGTSAVTGAGVPTLLENIALVAELKELKANPKRPASGNCLEASLDPDAGVRATLLVRTGTLRKGDLVVCGTAFGRIRAMFDDYGNAMETAPPATPVAVFGLDQVPAAGEPFAVLTDTSQAREIVEQRRAKERLSTQSVAIGPIVSLDKFHETLADKKIKELLVIIKTDTRGSLEAIRKEIDGFEHNEVRVRILHTGVGAITESDVVLAEASKAFIIGFHVAADNAAQAEAANKGVEIRTYEIIYDVVDDIKKALEGLLDPETREVQLGRAVVQEVFYITKIGTVAGCRVVSGVMERNAKIRLIRDGVVVGTFNLESLKRYKDDAKEVREGMECGMKLANFNDVKHGDILEAFKIEQIKRTL